MKTSKKGFTIVELMIVVAVMAILATVGFFTYTNVQKQARDSVRRSELKGIATALQTYAAAENDNVYPTNVTPSEAEPVLGGPLADYGNVPNDPDYVYVSSDGTMFGLCVGLENGALFSITSSNLGGTEGGSSDDACAEG